VGNGGSGTHGLHFVATSIPNDGCEMDGLRTRFGVVDMPIVERE
jgi:hypothetical protein